MPKPKFSQRELEIVEAISKGRSLKAIAEKAGAKEETVREQAEALRAKLYASSTAEIPARFAEYTGWANAPTDWPGAVPADEASHG